MEVVARAGALIGYVCRVPRRSLVLAHPDAAVAGLRGRECAGARPRTGPVRCRRGNHEDHAGGPLRACRSDPQGLCQVRIPHPDARRYAAVHGGLCAERCQHRENLPAADGAHAVQRRALRPGSLQGSARAHRGLREEGFIFVFQDVRGRYLSEGEFVDMRPHNPAKRGREFDESSDTRDTIDWLLAHVAHHNGKVGQWGISYPGFYASMGAIDSHPALKAVSPQAPIADWWRGDDMHRNG
ncbi:MAG: CocE/NonD family hydrolase, partial [Rhodanobacteraceae bacterium]|nr:CocE/NonD family hydrolase [Rhodanobacteraceae bacterium]